MEELLRQILGRLDRMEQQNETRFNSLEGRFDNLEGQVRENINLLKAIQHNTEVLNAKVEALTLTTASKYAVARLDAKFEMLNSRLFQQEVEIHQLKAIKQMAKIPIKVSQRKELCSSRFFCYFPAT